MSSDCEGTLAGAGRSTAISDLVDSIANEEVAAPAPTPGRKRCCTCGKDVAGQTRYKDGHGRYWCYDCGMDDHVRKHPEEAVPCEGCGEKLSPTKLAAVDNKRVCGRCAEKVAAQKKRDAARHARAEAQAREADARRRTLLVAGSAVAAAGVAAVVLYTAF
ncbi:MAG TPA: hypothetical protein VK324_04785 [Tepidisphaeraceae bacterium]|nr:hypothetical protein [Tepidisphaeraceae bacterium]